MTSKVAVVMGSDSDMRVMKDAIEVLDQLEVEYELRVLSAHRTPEKMREFAESAKSSGISVIVAGAGGAAHLPGMIASYTLVPVIGVPISVGTLSGVDSLYSIVQMPKGIPVGCMAIDNAWNAGLLASQILAISDEGVFKKLEKYRADLKELVKNKDAGLQEKYKGK